MHDPNESAALQMDPNSATGDFGQPMEKTTADDPAGTQRITTDALQDIGRFLKDLRADLSAIHGTLNAMDAANRRFRPLSVMEVAEQQGGLLSAVRGRLYDHARQAGYPADSEDAGTPKTAAQQEEQKAEERTWLVEVMFNNKLAVYRVKGYRPYSTHQFGPTVRIGNSVFDAGSILSIRPEEEILDGPTPPPDFDSGPTPESAQALGKEATPPYTDHAIHMEAASTAASTEPCNVLRRPIERTRKLLRATETLDLLVGIATVGDEEREAMRRLVFLGINNADSFWI